jgi:hypothetical protein
MDGFLAKRRRPVATRWPSAIRVGWVERSEPHQLRFSASWWGSLHSIHPTACAVVAALLLSVTVGRAVGASDTPPLAINPNQLYIVADPRLKGKLEGATMTLHPFERYSAKPVLVPEYPWERKTATERGFVQLGGTVMYDEQSKQFKMWYAAWSGKDFDRNCVCYATSDDGIHWNKPTLGIHEFDGSRANNIVTLGNPAVTVCKDPAAKDPAKRWIMWGKQCRPGENGQPADYGVYRFFSTDGIHWTREQKGPNLPYHYPDKVLGGVCGDAGMTFWLPGLGWHVAIHQTVRRPCPRAVPNEPKENVLRVFVRFDSRDGHHWGKPTVAFEADQADFKFDPYIQFYNVSIHEFGDLYIAMMGQYHPLQKKIDIGVGFSADTFSWERHFRGKAVLPLGPPGAFDCSLLFPASSLVEKDGLWWLYYSGDNSPHGSRVPNRAQQIGLARLPVGRIVSVDAGATAATYETPLLRVPGGVLRVNCDAQGGQLRAEVLDTEGRVVDARSGDECVPIVGDQTDAAISWSKGPAVSVFAEGETVRLRFHMKNAKLFGFRFER